MPNDANPIDPSRTGPVLNTPPDGGLKPYLTPLSVWGLSLGCAVGWGAFVMPGTTFLPIGGPLGTTLGMALGAVVMLIIGVNYHYMIQRYPDAGGTYSYSKRVLGYDHGFLSAWFLILVYIAITWANATALPLIARNLLAGTFQFGFHYTLAGFDVYGGEVLLSLTALLVFGAVCIRGGRFAANFQTAMAFLLFAGVVISFLCVCIGSGGGVLHITPRFVPGKNPTVSIFNIMALAPWAFAGFESISNSAEEFLFSTKKSFPIMFIATVAAGTAYICLALIAASALPEGYDNWLAYVQDLGNLSGLAGLPTFHAVNAYMGGAGLLILGLTVSAGVITGLLGNYIAASRLIYAIARDDLLPAWFARLNHFRTPQNAALFVMLISLPIPFLGRTAIGWIVDVNTIGATIAYAYTSVTAFLCAREEQNTLIRFTGLTGAVISILFFLYFMVPNLWTVSALSTESYLILVFWSIFGFVFFRYLFRRDEQRRLGKSTVAWIVLLFLIFFTSMLWFRQANHNTTREVLDDLNYYNQEELAEHGIVLDEREQADSEFYLAERMEVVNRALARNSIIQMSLIVIALFIMFNIYNSMMRRESEMEVQKMEAEQSNSAKSIFLSNMSHDIRTPMNAIIGYTALARRVKNLPQEEMDYLDKIEASSEHLLDLINDVLEMSRIESGKMELEEEKADLVKTMGEVRNLFAAQMESKGLIYTVEAEQVANRMVLCDRSRLNRVLLNLISNSWKFTPKGGRVTVTLAQTGAAEGIGSYELRIRDTGMGMSQEFAARIFEAYSRERAASKIQGTGLGMAITKNIVDLMGGTIEVKTRKGKGTEFIIHVDFALAEESPEEKEARKQPPVQREIDFSKIRLLLVEDNEINREIATILLEDAGFTLDTAENGKIAVDKLKASPPGTYQLVLMDVQMPVMNGYEATKAIRALDTPELAQIPIVAMTANAFAEDIQAARDAGMNSHIAKPIDMDKMMETLIEVLRE